jgi:DNA-binding transcriptional LysR family regulator
LAFGLTIIPTTNRVLEVELLFGEDLLLVLPKHHRLAHQRRIWVADLDSEFLVVLNNPSVPGV